MIWYVINYYFLHNLAFENDSAQSDSDSVAQRPL